jgi:hypothetical protein
MSSPSSLFDGNTAMVACGWVDAHQEMTEAKRGQDWQECGGLINFLSFLSTKDKYQNFSINRIIWRVIR